MGDRFNFFLGALEAPLGVAKRRINIPLHAKERMQCDEFNMWLSDRINKGIPTAVVRFGGTEMKSLRKYEYNTTHNKTLSYESECEKLCALSGFFPNNAELIPEFCRKNIELLDGIDAIGLWDLPFERYFVQKYMNSPIQTELDSLEPYNSSSPWTSALAGKKVLVIHPFADSIKEQYLLHREELFKDSKVLPKFELNCIKAVQSLGGVPDRQYETWFDALESMYQATTQIDFDVAIIGCGAYGMPLALRIKKDGKTAVHLGGATQMLFGIYGKRWEGNPLINEHWIRPKETERSVNFSSVEQGCYW